MNAPGEWTVSGNAHGWWVIRKGEQTPLVDHLREDDAYKLVEVLAAYDSAARTYAALIGQPTVDLVTAAKNLLGAIADAEGNTEEYLLDPDPLCPDCTAGVSEAIARQTGKEQALCPRHDLERIIAGVPR